MIAEFGLIIGAMRCGTTGLFHTLAQHPEVCPSSVREPTFFTDPSQFIKRIEHYEKFFKWNPGQHKIAVEKSTHNTKYPRLSGAPSRMRQVCRRFSFIYMVRDPIEMIESARLHMLARQPEKFDGCTKDIVRTAMFGTPSAVLIVSLDEFQTHHATIVQRVCQHLGISQLDLDPVSPVNTSDKNKKTVGEDRRYILSELERGQMRDRLTPDMQLFRRLTEFDVRVWGF